jgi:hypothetical protein
MKREYVSLDRRRFCANSWEWKARLRSVIRPDAVTSARALVADRYPRALQAWLSGSLVLGGSTPTSDLDITVLLDAADVHRESVMYEGWPVELFVHTESSIRHFVSKDLKRRRPTMARLVSTGVPLVAGDGGALVREECAAVLAAGPGPLSESALALARYSLTDLLDDLEGGGPSGLLDAVAIEVWRATAELHLATAERWSGTGKWLIREVEALDAVSGSAFAERLHEGLQAAFAGSPAKLVTAADDVLDRVGGRLWSGFRLNASITDFG